MTPIPLDETLREMLPAAWTADGRRHDRACLDVCGYRVWVSRLPFPPPERSLVVHVVEGDEQIRLGGRPSARHDIIDAVVECVRRAIQAERPVRAADVPVWAHDRVRSCIMVAMRDRGVRARYDALLAEINALG